MKQLFGILFVLITLSCNAFSQNESRIIKMEKPDEDDEEIYLELTELKVAKSDIFFNESFTANENWLQDLKVKVKNISGKPMTCVSIGFGLLGGIDEELEPQMSWEDKFGLSYGECSIKDGKKNKVFLKDNEEIVLNYSNLDNWSKKYYEKQGFNQFHSAKLIYGTVKFADGEIEDTFYRVPNNARFFE